MLLGDSTGASAGDASARPRRGLDEVVPEVCGMFGVGFSFGFFERRRRSIRSRWPWSFGSIARRRQAEPGSVRGTKMKLS